MLEKEVNEEVDRKICDFFKKTGNLPENLYLGRYQMEEMRKLNLCVYPGPGLRNSYNGCSVFEVNARNHLGVS